MGFVRFFWFILYEKFSVRSRRGGTAWDKIESPSSFSFFFFFFLSSLSPLVYASAPWKQQNNAPWSSTTPCSLFSCVSAWDTVVKMIGTTWSFSFLFSFLFLSPLSLPVPHTRTNRTNLQTLKITEQLLLASKLISCSSCQGSDSQIKTKQWLLTWKLDCNLQPRDVLELLPPRTCSAVHLQQRAMQCWPPLPPWAESLAPPRVAL